MIRRIERVPTTQSDGPRRAFDLNFLFGEGSFKESDIRALGQEIAADVARGMETLSGEGQATLITRVLSISELLGRIHTDEDLSYNTSSGECIIYSQRQVIDAMPTGVSTKPAMEAAIQEYGITLSEMEHHLEPIRDIILEEIATVIPSEQIHSELRKMFRSQRVWETVDGAIVKHVLADSQNPSKGLENPERYRQRIEALTKLYELRDAGIESDHVLYSLVDLEVDRTMMQPAIEVHAKENFQSLRELIEFGQLQPAVAMQFVIGAMRGGKFLIENGMGLMDISAENIGVTEDGKGVLFDMDGLRLLSHRVVAQISRGGYDPITRSPNIRIDLDMVGQFGDVMGKVRMFSGTQEQFTQAGCDVLATTEPNELPSIDEAITLAEAYRDLLGDARFVDSVNSVGWTKKV